MPGAWYTDPSDPTRLRWWDGQRWSDHVALGGVVTASPLPSPPPVTAALPPPPPPAYGAPAYPYGTYGGPPVGDERLPAGIELANPWARLGAYLLDVLLLVVTLFLGWLVWTLIVWSKGQTPGKQICGQRVVMKDTGRAAGWGRMCLRDFVIRGLAIGLLTEITLGIFWLVSTLMIFSAFHETMWDKWAGTLVVNDREGRTRAPA